MTIEITGVTIKKNKVTIDAVNLDAIFEGKDLYEDYEAEPVTFEFDTNKNNHAELKYLYKIVSTNRRCADGKSIGDKLEKLIGAVISLSDSFLVKAA